VQVNGSTRDTEFRNVTQLFAKLQAGDVAKVGTVQVAVVNPPPGGGTSAPAMLEADQPAPTISSFEPEVLSRGASDLKILGAGFVKESVVTLNGRAKQSSFVTVVSASELTVKLAADDTGPGLTSMEVEISNPLPGGGQAKKEIELK
jgi:trimeric autotransporter adhesin